jgi:hypothetical protein
MAESIAELRKLSDGELIERHDAHAQRTDVGTNHYLQELYRRDQDRVAKEMLTYTRRITGLTWWIMAMTVLVTVATVSNLVAIVWFGR